MARRIINKACTDLVGAGTEVPVSMGPEIPRKPSVLKLSSKDVSYGNRQVVEIRPIDGRQVPKGPPRMAHPLKRDNVKPVEKGGDPHFVNIDGDGSAKRVDVPREQKAVPQTAYKMRSFMSSVELGPRGHSHSPVQANQNAVKPPPPPRREPDIPKVPKQPEDAKMFLPKGIHHTDQPYVVPKFMPSYREMMVPKPKPDPLVSIVETTPPSLQKWAVEWNAEPKKTISIDELKEDLIREAAEKSHKPPGRSQRMSYIHQTNPGEDGKSDQPNINLANEPFSAEPTEKPHPNASERGTTQPWKGVHAPTSYETTMDAQALKDPEPKLQKIGQPLVDWVPRKYTSPNRRQPNDPRVTEYSFQEAIKNGTPKKAGKNEPAEPKPFFPKPAGNAIYFDTEEQKFHEWFKEKMSAAVQLAVNQPSKAMPKNKHAYTQVPQSNTNTFTDPINSNVALPANPSGQNKTTQAQRNPINNINQSNSQKDLKGTIPGQDQPKPANNGSTSYEPESNSSFYHWLKLRGHHIVKNDPNQSENKKERETINQNLQNVPQFPWSVSYTLRNRVVTTPTVVPKRPKTSKNLKKSPKTVSQDDMTLKHANMEKTTNSSRNPRNSIKNPGKKIPKTISERSVKCVGKKSVKSAGKVSVKNLKKKMPKPERPHWSASADQIWLNDVWNVDSEIDHVNNLRKMEIFGVNPKVTNMKKLFPSLGAPQMKYWESKYTKKAEPARNQKAPQTVDGEAKPDSYNWFRSKKANDGIKNAFKEVLVVKRPDNGADRRAQNSNFSNIAEYSAFPLKLSQNAKDEVMDFSEEFDIDRFLYKEEAVEKELLESAQGPQENKVKTEEKTENEQPTEKVRGKEHLKFPRSVKVHTEANEVDLSLRKRVQQKLDEDEFVLALGEDPGLEDLEWSEFIGPKNSLDDDSDLTRLIGAQARQLGSVQHSCL